MATLGPPCQSCSLDESSVIERIKLLFSTLSSLNAVCPTFGSNLDDHLRRLNNVVKLEDTNKKEDIGSVAMVLIYRGLDQEAWDWLSPLAMGGRGGPYTFTSGVNAFAQARWLSNDILVLSAAILVYVRLVLDVKHLRALRFSESLHTSEALPLPKPLHDRLPPELYSKIRAYVPSSGVLSDRSALLRMHGTPFDYEHRRTTLEQNIRRFCSPIGLNDCPSREWPPLLLAPAGVQP